MMSHVDLARIRHMAKNAIAALCALAFFCGAFLAHGQEDEGQEGAAPKYVLEFEHDILFIVVTRLRSKYALRVCSENRRKNRETDMITLKERIGTLTEAAEQRELTPKEQHHLKQALGLLEQGAGLDMGVDDARHLFFGRFEGDTVPELLDALCADGPYGWVEDNGTYVIVPREGSRLEYPVTLSVDNMSIHDVVDAIGTQDPSAQYTPPLIGSSAETYMRIHELTVPRLELVDVPAIEALCRAVEGAGGQLAWNAGTLIGWSDSWTVTIHPLPELWKAWEQHPRRYFEYEK